MATRPSRSADVAVEGREHADLGLGRRAVRVDDTEQALLGVIRDQQAPHGEVVVGDIVGVVEALAEERVMLGRLRPQGVFDDRAHAVVAS
jgi:hypothetical protein